MTNINLNIQQLLAVNSTSRITYVNAGAGTGKTTTLEARIEKIARKTAPWNIIVLAFNTSIVKDIKERLAKHISAKKVDKMQIYTIHAYALKILSKQVKIKNELLDQEKLVKFIRNTWNKYKKLNHYKKQNRKDSDGKTQQVIDTVLKCRENNSYIKQCSKEMQLFYRAFKQELKKSKSFDFARIVKVATKYIPQSNTPQYIFVDEFQDTSETRFNFIKALVGNNNYLFAAGDEDQQILEWCGVKNNNVSKLYTLYQEELKEYKLEYSYRLTQTLAQKSNQLLGVFNNRISKILIGENKAYGQFYIRKFKDSNHELCWCKNIIHNLLRRNVKAKDIAVLYRCENMMYRDLDEMKVHQSTIHKAKGLEFEHVIIIGLEEGIFPRNTQSIEEDLRVLYVAMTRAKKSLTITYIDNAMRKLNNDTQMHVKKSRFLQYLK
ncbi:MAG: ATP-dependent helicase [Alphaproteobacteria bacterium]